MMNHGSISTNTDGPVRKTPLPTKALGADLTGDEELSMLRQAIASKTLFRHYGPGKPVMAETLERRMRERFGVRYALAVSSGSAALFCSLAGIGIGPGDEVILPAFSWYSCYNAIVLQGALPVFGDIDRSLNLDPADFARKITPRTKAVLVVHYQGGPAKMDEILDMARRHGIKVLEDGAQSIGARYHGRYCSTVGDVGTFSFQGNKIVVAGEGGMVLTNDPVIFEHAVRYHDHGHVRPVFAAQLGHDGARPMFPGNQYRMGELAAAVALAQFDRLDGMLSRCRAAWDRVRSRVCEALPEFAFRQTGDDAGDAGITLFIDLKTPTAAAGFGRALMAEGIALGPSSGMVNLLHEDYILKKAQPHPALPPFGPDWPGEKVAYSRDCAPLTDEILGSMVAIGIGPRFTQEDADDIAAAIVKTAGQINTNPKEQNQ
jgi:8-amino-3,8-dideoxy-alpha-D-manno-octulosonate transaminase